MPGGSPSVIAAVFRAVRTGNAFEETVERLLEGVKLGVYAPGDRLPPERELTRRLGVSRITLREALRELAAAGYVETKRGRFGGTFIIRTPEPLVPDEFTRTARDMGSGLDDALTFRRVVETGAAEMAAGASLTRQQRENLAECLAAMQDCGLSGYRQAATRLHLAIADAAGSPQLTASVVEARVRLVDLLNAIPMLERNLEDANVQHASIVRAILADDPERARRAMAEHVAGTAALLRGFLGDSVLARETTPRRTPDQRGDYPSPRIPWLPSESSPPVTPARPSLRLQHLVRTRNARCTAPGCDRPAARCDPDHTIAWHLGGLTCECDLAPLCRHHHRAKQAEGWRLEQPEPGVLIWRTPAGRTYVTRPTLYPV